MPLVIVRYIDSKGNVVHDTGTMEMATLGGLDGRVNLKLADTIGAVRITVDIALDPA